MRKPRSNAEESLALILQVLGYQKGRDFARDYQFAKEVGRKFEIDFAFIARRLGFEVDGGIWRKKGAHSGGVAITRDIEKHNLAIEMNWRLVRFTPQMVRDGTALATIERLMR